nr:alpha/beta hydrolase [Rhodococcus trifolii]
MAFRDSGGDDPVPVVLVHGMGGDGYTWDRLAGDLVGHGRRVIVPDLRGHGRSAHTASYEFAEFGKDIERLVDHLGVDRFDIVGHSLGGYASSLVAQWRPSAVRRLVIEESPLPISPGDPPPTITNRFPTVRELMHATTSALRHPRAVLAFDRSMTSSALAQFRTPNAEWWHALRRIEAETLVVVGGPSGMMDPTRLVAMSTGIAHCEVVTIPIGHSVHRDGYDRFEAAVVPFLMRG